MKIKKTEIIECDDLNDLPQEVQDHFKKETLDGLDFMLFGDGTIWVTDEYTDSGREPDKDIKLLDLIKGHIDLHSGTAQSKAQKDESNEEAEKLIKILRRGIAILEKAKF